MRIFISWSGEKSASQRFAEGLADWLENILPPVKPFYSTEDIKKGQAWFEKIAQELDASDFGILCLTPANFTSSWISFEAGAIAKKVGRGKVVPVVLGMAFADLKPPLSMFNGAMPTREDLLRLVKTINAELGDQKLGDSRLAHAFEKWWPDIDQVTNDALQLLKKAPEARAHPERRDTEDMLREVLDLLRARSRENSTTELMIPSYLASLVERLRPIPPDSTSFFRYTPPGGTSFDDVASAILTALPDGTRIDRDPAANPPGFVITVPASNGPAASWAQVLHQAVLTRLSNGRNAQNTKSPVRDK